MSENLQRLKNLIGSSENIVFFGGAGVSTESGIPDFRSKDGLYSQKYKYPPEEILSHDFFIRNTKDFYDFYRDKMIFPHAKPNKAHTALAELEKAGKVKAVVTQNIDGLHQAAGSVNVIEFHGSVLRNYCMKCGEFYGVSAIVESTGVPLCGKCGGIIKPDVVLYQEPPDMDEIRKSARYIAKADMLIIGGTSLTVYPAAGLIEYYRGNKLALINKSPTHIDDEADLVINGSIGEALSYAV
jgi:NAD-dependent deacetylase